MAKNPKKKKQLVDKQIELIDKQIKAVPRILTNIQMQNLILEREKLILSKEDTQQYREEDSGVTPTMGLKAIGAAAAFGGDTEMVAAVGLLATGVGKKIFGGLFKNKNQTQEDKETNTDSPDDDGSPEKRESKNKNYTDNDVIISILNKILNAFENDNERMRRSIRDSEEKKLESDPTPDKIGSPEKVKDKKTDMNKLLMFGAIAGLIGSAFLFKNAIGAMLSPITDMLRITDPTADADKEDYDFDIMDMLGVTSLLGMLGLGGKAALKKAAGGAAGVVAGGVAGAAARSGAAGGAAGGVAGGAATPAAAVGSAEKAAAKAVGVATKIAAAVAKRVSSAMGPIAARSIPFLGAAIGAGIGIYELVKGNYVGAALSVAGGIGGPLTAIPAAALDIANDVYKEVYGTYAANDAVNGVLGNGVFEQRMTEIKESVNRALTEAITVKLQDKPEFKGARLTQKEAQGLLQSNTESPLSENDLKAFGGLERITDIANGGKGYMSTAKPSSAGDGGAERVPAAGAPSAAGGSPSAAGGAPSAAGGSPSAAGAPTGTGEVKEGMKLGSPAVSPAPAEATSGSSVTAATMDASEAQNSVTVLPPMISNESNTMKSGNEDASKAQKMTMQVRLNDDVFRKAVESTAAVLKMMKAA